MKFTPRELKLLLINLLVFFVFLVTALQGSPKQEEITIQCIEFWVMEVGFFVGKGSKNG